MSFKRLKQMLLDSHLIDEASLDRAVKQQKQTGDRLEHILLSMGLITEPDLLNLLSKQMNVPYIDLPYYDLDPNVLELLSEVYARKYHAIVLKASKDHLLVGMIEPLNLNATDAISKILKKPIKTVLVGEIALRNVLDRFYRRTSEISNFVKELSREMGETHIAAGDALFSEANSAEEDRAPVVKLLNSLFHDAVQAGASDIHIEPDQKTLRIRLRVDGVLNEYIFNEKRITTALIQRLKLRANLDISEHRIPLDGSFNFAILGQAYDVRLSTIPTVNGESLVMRLLKQSTAINDLWQLGFDKKMIKRMEAILTKPFGMLLVTGPTGSGKSTTLYSILSKLNTPERKIITVEDPVEYRVGRLNQVQVNEKIDLTFSRVLRAVLRQDPDIIMIGEIRDVDTALIGMRAAITGHFVLATLHTNDAISSALRLIDMGAEGFMVAAAVKAIIAQRLVRNLCRVCIKDHAPDELETEWLRSLQVDPSIIKCKKAEGCAHCDWHGYVGRTGIYELLELNDEMITALRLNDVVAFSKIALASKSYRPLAQSALTLVKQGITSINEAIRIVGHFGDA
jgi:MSHA biogenesis protein MshE